MKVYNRMNRYTIVALTAVAIIATSSAAWWLWSTNGEQTELPIDLPLKRITNMTIGIITDSAEAEQKFEFIANYALAEVNEYAAKQGNLTRFKYVAKHADDVWAPNVIDDDESKVVIVGGVHTKIRDPLKLMVLSPPVPTRD